MVKRNEEKWFLVEVNESGEEFVLQKTWNGSGFQTTPIVSNAHIFATEQEAKNGCKLQGMMNTMFGSSSKVYYVKENIVRVRYDETGTVDEIVEPEPVEEVPTE
ncbi:hypothetical protein [Mammaliicoccus sciuri]|uniref:hypothetical protein n=1 Tax=Mammaliicoccus sciuri TaxID=1296 RepID=UPI002DB732A5|nr:hypothetical protein [Mammaliicoccus sciuri]MEB5757394.1 hypothetical protein [Mammaliicoccus sciuri]